MKAFLGFLVVAVIGAAVVAWQWRGTWEEKPRFRTLEAKRGDLLISVSATGTVEPVEVVDVGAQIIGRIKEFGPDPGRPGKTVDHGSKVKKGDVLALLDDAPSQAELEKAKANLKLAQAELLRDEAHLKQAERDYERAKSLRDTNSESDYDRAVAQFEVAKADIAYGQARVEQAGIALKQAEINVGYTRILAPIDGVLIDRRVNVGQTVVAGLNAPSLFLLARDLNRMQVWAAVNEADISEIHEGQKVMFKVDAYRDRTFSGVVSQIRLNAGMSNSVVTYGVVVDIDNSDGKLLPYMTANLQFEVARRDHTLLVPNQALRWRPTLKQITPGERAKFQAPAPGEKGQEEPVEVASPIVWLQSPDGLVHGKPVTAGLSDGMSTEIKSDDLPEGSLLVVGTMRRAKRDFVSSFVSRVTKTGTGE